MKAPAFQFFVKDWLTDTRGMSLEVKGAHIDLLAYSWAKGPLPNDEPELARILGVVVRVFRSLWRVLSRCWKLTKRGWINRRLEQTRREQRQYRRLQAEKGRLSAAKRLNRGSNRGSTAVQPEPQPKVNSASAPSPTPASTRKIKIVDPALRALWLTFWGHYPRKVNKPQAEKAFYALNPDAETFAAMMAALEWQSNLPEWTRDEQRFVPHAATYLNNRRWEDEAPQVERPRTLGPDYAAAPDWETECQAQHGGSCASAYVHSLRREAS